MTMNGSIGAIGAQGSAAARAVQQLPGDTGRIPLNGGPSFADTLKQAIGDVSALQESAQDAIAAFVRGDPVELHEVMAATEEAGIALDFLIEIRNRITEAYRTVISMQT